jgi:hypothetical protein
MYEPQQLGAKEVVHDPIVLRCGDPKWVVAPVRLCGDVAIEVCPVNHEALAAIHVDGETLWGHILHVTSTGDQCFVRTAKVQGWFSTQELQKWNCGLRLENVPGDGSLGVKGWAATIGAMIVSVMVMRGCDQGSRLVLPREHVPAVEKQ